MGGSCNTDRKDEKCKQFFLSENLKGRNQWKDIEVGENLVLE